MGNLQFNGLSLLNIWLFCHSGGLNVKTQSYHHSIAITSYGGNHSI